jgi:hypothetical protein
MKALKLYKINKFNTFFHIIFTIDMYLKNNLPLNL